MREVFDFFAQQFFLVAGLNLYLLRSYSSREPFSKSECANIVQATEKVDVALDSLVNGLKDSLSDKMC